MAYASRLLLGADLAAELLGLPRSSSPRILGLVDLVDAPPGVQLRSLFNGRVWEASFLRPTSPRVEAFRLAFKEAARRALDLEKDQVFWFSRRGPTAVAINYGDARDLRVPHLRVRRTRDAA